MGAFRKKAILNELSLCEIIKMTVAAKTSRCFLGTTRVGFWWMG